MKSTYTDEELARDFVYPVVSLDRDKMLATPELRDTALRGADASIRSIFGPSHRDVIDVTPQKQIPRTVDVESGEMLPQPAAGDGGDLFDDTPTAAAAPEKTPLEKGRETLEAYRPKLAISPKATKFLDATLAKADLTLEEISAAIDRFEGFLQAEREKGATA